MTSPLYFRTREWCCMIGLRVVGYYIQHRQEPIDRHLLSPSDLGLLQLIRNQEGKQIGAWEISEGIDRVASGRGYCLLYIPLLSLPWWQTVTDMKLYRCWLSSVGVKLVLSGITACLGNWVSWCGVGKPGWTPNCQGCTVSHTARRKHYWLIGLGLVLTNP